MENFVFGKAGIEDLNQGHGTFGPVTLPDGSTATLNKIGIQSFLGSAYVSAADFAGANAGAQINAAVAALPSTGGVVDARSLQGVQAWSTTVAISRNVLILLGASTFSVTTPAFSFSAGNLNVIGMSIADTVINLSGSGQWNLNPAYATEYIGFSNLTINSASASVDAVVVGYATVSFPDMTRYVTIHDVLISGPGINAAGTARGVNVVGMDQARWTNMDIRDFPGVGLYMDGDYGGENRFTSVNVDASGSWNIHIKKLTQLAIGGWYFVCCTLSNRSYTSFPLSKGFYFDMPGPTQENTTNLFWVSGAIDQCGTGSAFYIKNCQHISISNAQIQSFSTDAADAALRFENVNNVSVVGCYVNAYTKVFSFEGVCIGYNIVGNTLFSSAGNYTTTYGYWFDSAVGKGDIDISNTNEISSATTSLLALTNNYAWMESARTNNVRIPNAVGWSVRGTQTFYNIDNDFAISTKTLSVDNGYLRIKNGSDGLDAFTVYEGGVIGLGNKVNQLAANKWATTKTILSGTNTITWDFDPNYTNTPIAIATPLTNPTVFWWVNVTNTQVSVITSANVPYDVAFSIMLVGNPD